LIPSADGITLSEYKSVRNKLSIKVDLPSPDSPENTRIVSQLGENTSTMELYLKRAALYSQHSGL